MADAKSHDDACKSCHPGHYQNEAARSECEACLPGKWNDQNGMKDASNCKNCTKGTYSSAEASGEECNKCAAGKMNDKVGSSSSDDCEDCPAGYLQPEPEQSKCSPVEAGSIVAKGGSASVVVPLGSKIKASAPSGFEACEAGTIGNEPPNEACEKCTAGKSSTKGATECHPCDKGKFSDKDGTTCQECQAGTFQDQNSLPSLSCRTCPTGYNNNVPGESSCQDLGHTKPEDCNDMHYLNDTAIDPKEWECDGCPIGASCVGNINWDGVHAKFGWSRCHNNEAAFERCTFPGACLGGENHALMRKYYLSANKQIDLADYCKNGNCTAQCNTAYVNASILCGQCAHDFSHDGLTGRCDRCPPAGENTGVAIGGGLLGLLGIVVYIQLTLSDGGRLDESDGAKSIGLSFIQLISLLVTFPIAW